ncbi:unnamed protein product [Trichobilharzia szidati]|nr:unnamed protein product [Trichobilharzia szidati]
MEADPAIVLEWLDAANDDLRELQLTALEQLCNEVLFSDNIDVFFERYPPRLFIPALCKIFLDELAPDSVLEANARALTYYLDVSLDCAPRIARSPNVLTAMTSRLDAVDMTSAKSNELGQQIIKMLQLICTREPGAVYTAGGLTSVLRYIRLYPHLLHADVLQAGMDIIRRLFTRADPTDKNLTSWIDSLSSLLDRREIGVADQALRAFANLVARFTRTGTDPTPLADPHIIDCLLQRLRVAGGVEADSEVTTDPSGSNQPADTSGGGRDGLSVPSESNPVVVHAVTSILTSLCCNSLSITRKLLTNDGQFAMTLAMVVQRSTDELVVISVLRLIEILLVLLYQNHHQHQQQHLQPKLNDSSQKTEEMSESTSVETAKHDISKKEPLEGQSSKQTEFKTSVSILEHAENSQCCIEQPERASDSSALESQHSWEGDAVHRHFIEAIKRQDIDFMKCSLKSGKIDVNYMDHLGQTLLNWAASFGSPAMVELLCAHGANVNLGVRSPLDYAASFGRVDVCRTLLNWGADINKRDAQGRRPIDRAREHPDFPGSHQVIDMLESEAKRVSLRGLSSNLDKPDKQTDGSSSISSSSASPSLDSNKHGADNRDNDDPAEAQRLFVHQLLPLLVGLFRESTSSSVRHQCTLLVWRMIHYMHPDHLEAISLMENQSVPFAFSLTQMIYTVLIEEREELILRALELCLRLLHKSPSIYTLVFYRLGLMPLIQILVDILHHLIIESKPTTIDQQQHISVASPASDENNAKDMCTTPVSSTVNTTTTTTATSAITTASSTSSPSSVAASEETPTTTPEKATVVVVGESQSPSTIVVDKSTEDQEEEEAVGSSGVNLTGNDNDLHEILSKAVTEQQQQQPQQKDDKQSISPPQNAMSSTTTPEPPVYLNAQLYNWNGWYFFCMGQLLSIFNGFAFITIQLQPEDGCLRILCIHHYGNRSSPTPVQLHPGENPFPRPGLKSRMLRMHQHLMELVDSNITIIPLFQEDNESEKNTGNEEKQQVDQSTMSVYQTRLSILGDSSLYNLEASRNNARRFRRRLGLRHDPVSTHIAASTAATVGSGSSKLQRQASSPARVCLTSKFSAKIAPHSPSSPGVGDTRTPNSVSFGSMVCSLLKQKDGTYVSVKPRVSSLCGGSKPLFSEALLLSENSCSGFKRVRIASVGKEASASALSDSSSVNNDSKSSKAIPKVDKNPRELLKSAKRHSRSFISMFSQLDLPLSSVSNSPSVTPTNTTTPVTPAASASICSQDIPEIFDFDSLIGNSDPLNVGVDYLQFWDESAAGADDNSVVTDVDEKCTSKDDEMITATKMELSRIDKLFFPDEIVHETYNSGQLVVLLRSEDDDSRPEMAAERLSIVRKYMLTLSEKLLEKLQYQTNLSLEKEEYSSSIIDKIGPIDGLSRIKKIVVQIWDAFKTDQYNNNTMNVTLNKLFVAFKQLSVILNEGEQTITAYELTTSGLIQVLLLCLSVAHAGRWRCHTFSVKLDRTTALLWYLQERRRVFVQNMLSRSKSRSISLLVRRLVQAFELTEHLPLRLFSAAHFSRSSTTSNTSEQASSDRTVVNSDAIVNKKSEHHPSSIVDKIGYAASLPINFINSSFNRCQLTVCTDSGDSVSINVKQPFQDSMDAKELSALLRFCPVLLDFPEFDSCVPSLHQIAKRLSVYLDKLPKPPSDDESGGKSCDNDSRRLYNWRGKALFVSPLATVNQLERFLSRMSTKQWYECPRADLPLWSQIRFANNFNSSGLCFPAPPPGNSSADYLGGVIDWLATNGNRHPLEDWVNPAMVGLVSIAASTSNPVKGRPVSILGPQAGALVGGYTIRGSGIGVVVKPKRVNCPSGNNQTENRNKKNATEQKSDHTSTTTATTGAAAADSVQTVTENETHAWIAIDLGLQLVPTAYTLAYLRRADASEHSLALRNWKLEASNDAISWTVLREHNNDLSIHSVSGSRATWSIPNCDTNHDTAPETLSSTSNTSASVNKVKGWRFFKIQVTGPNANGGKQLALGGLEFYGNVYTVHNSILTSSAIAQKIYSSNSLNEKKDISSAAPTPPPPPKQSLLSLVKSTNPNQVGVIHRTKDCATSSTTTTTTTTTTTEKSSVVEGDIVQKVCRKSPPKSSSPPPLSKNSSVSCPDNRQMAGSSKDNQKQQQSSSGTAATTTRTTTTDCNNNNNPQLSSQSNIFDSSNEDNDGVEDEEEEGGLIGGSGVHLDDDDDGNDEEGGGGGGGEGLIGEGVFLDNDDEDVDDDDNDDGGDEPNDIDNSKNNNKDSDDDDNDDDMDAEDDGENAATDEANAALMNILFNDEEEEIGSSDDILMMDRHKRSELDDDNNTLRLSHRNLDDLSSRALDAKILQCVDSLLANDKASPDLCRILRRIAAQDLNFSLSNKSTSRSMDSINAREEYSSTITGLSDNTKKVNSEEIDVTEPYCFMDQSNTESTESGEPSLGYLLNSIEPEAIEFADTVEAIIRSNTVQNRQDSDDSHVLDMSKSWKNIQSIHSKTDIPLIDQKHGSDDHHQSYAGSRNPLKGGVTVSEKVCHVKQKSLPSVSQSSSPSNTTLSNQPNNTKLSSGSLDDNNNNNKKLPKSPHPFSKQDNEISSLNVNISLDSSQSTGLSSSWKSSTHQPFRRRIRRPRPRPIVSSGSRETPASHSCSPCTGSPAVPLSWNEAIDSLRLPLGLIPAFIPNPGSTNAPGTTAYVLCHPPSSQPECTTNIEDSSSRLSLFLGVYMNSEYLIQIPLRDKNATLFKYIQELSEKFEMLEDSSKYRLSKSVDGLDKSKNSYVIKLGYRFWDAKDEDAKNNDEYCVQRVTQPAGDTVTPNSSAGTASAYNNEANIRTIYGQALLNKRDLRFTPSLDRPIKYTSSGIDIPIIGDDKNDGCNDDNYDASDKINNSLLTCEINAPHPPSNPEDILQLIKLLYQLSGLKESNELGLNDFIMDKKSLEDIIPANNDQNESIEVKIQDFVSSRLTNKLLRQIHDPLALASGALPNWCLSLSQRFNVIFSFDARSQLFTSCAFGPGRAAIWLQNRPLQKRSYAAGTTGTTATSLSETFSRAGSANSTSGRLSYRIFLPSSGGGVGGNASLISALLNNAAITTSNHNSSINTPDTSTNSNTDYVLLRPSILTHLLNATSGGTSNSNNNSISQIDSLDINSEHISSLESVLTSLGIPLPSSGNSLNCDAYFSDNNNNSNSNSNTTSDLLNCLLIHSNQNVQSLASTTMTTTSTTPNNGGSASGGGIGFNSEDRSTSNIGRLHKEFVRIPRLPHELLLTQQKNKYFLKLSPNYSYQSDKLTFWHWASRLMEEHASRKSELEIQFIGEEGTGLGPTLEFYSLLAAELRRRDGLMWVTDDFPILSQTNNRRPALPTISSSTTLEEHTDSSLGSYNSVDCETDDIDEASIYVNTPCGLFPAPWPGDQVPESVLHRFYILGITVAKCLQDNRRIDLPLSPPLLKLLSTYGSIVQDGDNHKSTSKKLESVVTPENCSSKDVHQTENNVDFSILSDVESAFQNILYSRSSSSSPTNQSFKLSELVQESSSSSEIDDADADDEFDLASFLVSPQYKRLYQCSEESVNQLQSSTTHWISGILHLNDFCLIYPERAKFMRQIAQFHCRKYKRIMKNTQRGDDFSQLANEIFGCDLEDLCISMEFLPPSKLFGFSAYPLKEYYEWERDSTEVAVEKKTDPDISPATPVSSQNVEKYLELTLAFCLDKGIRKQMDAFKDGFQRVLPLRWLALFTGTELGQLISGDSVAQWTREDLLAYTVPSLGFTKQSPTYQMLINVLSNFNLAERRAFLQFTTGCSSLPPGGLKNLHPRLRIVRKEVTNSGPYPSVNTCVHYLKLPEYQSEKELRTRLLQATKEIGFYLN